MGRNFMVTREYRDIKEGYPEATGASPKGRQNEVQVENRAVWEEGWKQHTHTHTHQQQQQQPPWVPTLCQQLSGITKQGNIANPFQIIKAGPQIGGQPALGDIMAPAVTEVRPLEP